MYYVARSRALRRAVEFNPNFALAHAFLATTLAARGVHAEAVNAADHALRLSPGDALVDAQASIAMAYAHFSVGRYADCAEWTERAVERFPEHPRAHAMLLEEGENGVVLNAKTGTPFTLADPCMVRETQLVYNAAAHQATVRAVKEFLTATFNLD